MNGKWFLVRFWAGVVFMMVAGEAFAAIAHQPLPSYVWGMTVGAAIWFAILVWIATSKKKG